MGLPYFFPNFFSIDNNLSCFLYSRLPSFYIFCVFLWITMHIIPIFLSNFLIFDNFDLIFGPPLHFFQFFFQLIITYHVFFILDYPHFIFFYVFFWIKMHKIPIFYQFFSFFSHFWPLWPNFWATLTIFFLFFSIDIN